LLAGSGGGQAGLVRADGDSGGGALRGQRAAVQPGRTRRTVCRSRLGFGQVTCGFSVGQAAWVYSLIKPPRTGLKSRRSRIASFRSVTTSPTSSAAPSLSAPVPEAAWTGCCSTLARPSSRASSRRAARPYAQDGTCSQAIGRHSQELRADTLSRTHAPPPPIVCEQARNHSGSPPVGLFCRLPAVSPLQGDSVPSR
jgi:hypothetical protein